MTPMLEKLAYILFSSCFAIWLTLILSAGLLSSGEFPNTFMLALFVGSAVLSSIPAMLIGLGFLGVDFRIPRRKQNSSNVLPSSVTSKRDLEPEASLQNDSVKELGDKKTRNHDGKNRDYSARELTDNNLQPTALTATTSSVPLETKGTRKTITRSKEDNKAFFIFGETEFKGCSFKLGYLKNLPRNKPIPDECFGCAQILECVEVSRNE
jgi:hypothetical protein